MSHGLMGIHHPATGMQHSLNIRFAEARMQHMLYFLMKEDKWRHSAKSVLSGCVIYDKDVYSADSYATNPAGCGPFNVTEFVTGASVTIERDPNYGRQMKASCIR